MSKRRSRLTMNAFLMLVLGLTLASSFQCAKKSGYAAKKVVCPGNQHKLETTIRFEQRDGTCRKVVAPERLCANKADDTKQLRWLVTSTCEGEQKFGVANFSPDNPLTFAEGAEITVASGRTVTIYANVKKGTRAGTRTYDVTRNGKVDSDPEVILADEP